MHLPEVSVRKCLIIPQLDSWVLDYSCRHRLEHLTKFCLEGQDIDIPDQGALPLRITSAALWNSVKRHCTEHYQSVLDFVNIIWQQAAGLVTYRHYLKLCIAFKAKLVMEMFVKRQSLLDILQTLDRFFPKAGPDDPKATRKDVVKERQCRLQFRKLVLLLIRDKDYREHFLQDELEEEYGTRFMASTRRLLWEFLERLDSILPRPRIDQLLAASMDVGCLFPGEQALLSVLANPHTSVPDVLLTLMQRIRQQRSQDLSNPSQSSSEMQSGIPRISSSTEPVLSGGHGTGAEQITPDPLENGGGNNAERAHGEERRQERTEQWVEAPLPETGNEGKETVNHRNMSTGSDTGTGMKLNVLRNGALAAAGTGREHDGETVRSSLVLGQNLVFSALHFDQSCEQFEDSRMLKLSPPDPLQSQKNLYSSSPVTACTSLQVQAAKLQSQLVNPPGLGSNADCPASETHSSIALPSQAHSGGLSKSDSLSPKQTVGNNIDLKVLAATALSLEVQEQLLHSPLFQPKVLLLRLTIGQNARPTVPERRGFQRDDPGADRGCCQLSGAANCREHRSQQKSPTLPWNLRQRPRELHLIAAQTPTNPAFEEQALLHQSSERSLLFSSEESSQSDTSDYEYFPFCSQIKASSKWNRFQRRNAIGQFIGSMYTDN
ncbi:uncharacterized protein [Heterodontus francisci]|uniref:uncharacterized protein isoform X2 n=1 Tax=Heterodontus francisci TaxID=7792 RepID=UPI00355C324B